MTENDMNENLCVYVAVTECLFPALYDQELFANVSSALTFEKAQAWLKSELERSKQIVEDYVRAHADEFEKIVVYGDVNYDRANCFSVNARRRAITGDIHQDEVLFWKGQITCHRHPSGAVMAALSTEGNN